MGLEKERGNTRSNADREGGKEPRDVWNVRKAEQSGERNALLAGGCKHRAKQDVFLEILTGYSENLSEESMLVPATDFIASRHTDRQAGRETDRQQATRPRTSITITTNAGRLVSTAANAQGSMTWIHIDNQRCERKREVNGIQAVPSPSSGLEDEVGIGRPLGVLVAWAALPVGVGLGRTLRQRLHHLCNTHTHTKSLATATSATQCERTEEQHTLVVLLLLPLVDVQRQLLHPHALLLLRLLLVEVVGGQVGRQRHVQDFILQPQTHTHTNKAGFVIELVAAVMNYGPVNDVQKLTCSSSSCH